MGVAMCLFSILIWPSHFLGASYVPEEDIVEEDENMVIEWYWDFF